MPSTNGRTPTMTLGLVAAGLSMILVAMAHNGYLFAAALIVMEATATLILYSTAFAALVQLGGRGAQNRLLRGPEVTLPAQVVQAPILLEVSQYAFNRTGGIAPVLSLM
ncbi:MAG TPA: hypothetical protein VN155_15360 [Devosia sp.]|nr:hypothetical protein [Devosia sp.]